MINERGCFKKTTPFCVLEHVHFAKHSELDMENHNKPMSLLKQKVKDKATLGVIRKYLRSGIIEGGVVSQRTEATTQN